MKKMAFLLVISFLDCPMMWAQSVRLEKISSPILFQGDEKTAYRDPAVLYENEIFHLYFTLTEIGSDGKIYMYTAYAQSKDLIRWSVPVKITPKNQALNYSSPGNLIKYGNEWVLCLQTYPRPDYTIDQMPRYGNKNARLFVMRSKDLKNWSNPELLRIKGDQVAQADMGRMIDPYLLEDKDEPGSIGVFISRTASVCPIPEI